MKQASKTFANWCKMAPVLFVFFTGLLPQHCFGAENYKVGDQLYVAPITGLHVRTSPSIEAPIVASLPFNTKVTVAADSLPAKPFEVTVSDLSAGKLTLQGHWVKVKAGLITGYAFDGMLSNFRGLQLGSYEDEPHFTALFGTPALKTIKKSGVIEGHQVDYETKITSYPQRLVMQSTFFDGCYEEVYTFYVSFNEAYWLIKRLMLYADAAQDIKIKKEGQETVLNFYSCT